MELEENLSRRFAILYAEDEEDDIFLLQRAFTRVGITNVFKAVKDGQEAIDYLSGAGRFADRKEYPLPGLILLDLNLPRKSGFDVLKWIREQPELRPILVICSSSGQPQDIQMSYQLGANGYVRKPANFDQLLVQAQAIKDYWLTQNLPPPKQNP